MPEARYALHSLSGETAGKSFAVQTELVVGRSTSSDLFVPDRRLSRRHARFYARQGRLYVEDLQSHNGTYVNGKRVTQMQLFGGDVVRVGTTQFEITPEGPDITQPAPDGSLTAQLVKPVEPEKAPSLGQLGADDYFEALGIGETGRLRGFDERQAGILVQQTRNFAILHEISKVTQSSTGMETMLNDVMSVVLKVIKADRAYVVLLDETGTLVPKAAVYREPGKSTPVPDRVAISETVAEQVISGRCGVITADALTDARFSGSKSVVLNAIRSLLAVPVIVGPRVIGLIELENTHTLTGFNENDLDLLSIVASMLGQSIDNITLAAQREETIAKLERARERLLTAQGRLVKNEQMAVIGRFASGVAHEVKNHLSPFMLADMIARSYPDDEDIQEASELMLEAYRRILGLVSEIKHFASGSAVEYDIRPHDLASVLEGVVRFARCDARIKACDLRLDLTHRPVAEIDANRLRQVFINLIRNAADAVEPGQGIIDLRMRERDGWVMIEVEDNGAGIDEDHNQQIFEPFFTTKGDAGLGLGLDISRHIVVSHGGSLTFESSVGVGTTFRIVLPLEQPMPDEFSHE